jgi:hypothetical protein
MRERPILFSAPMIRALLAGTKTQTRRIVRESPGNRGAPIGDHVKWFERGQQDSTRWCGHDGLGSLGWVRCPYGEPGGRLWVRETWYCDDYTVGDFEAGRVGYVSGAPTDAELIEQWRDAMDYRATHDCNAYGAGCPCSDDEGRSSWRPSIFMPRWASRITLEVIGVRVERLHGIAEADAKAEGVEFCETHWRGAGEHRWPTARAAFESLWCGINGVESWRANPWVWVVEFRDVEASA